MRLNNLVKSFSNFFLTHCFDEARAREDAGIFRFDQPPTEADWTTKWNFEAEHWNLFLSGALLNLRSFLDHFELNLREDREHILSLGSGLGIYETYLGRLFQEAGMSTIRLACVDRSMAMNQRLVELLRKTETGNILPITSTLDQLPFESDSVDHAICFDTIQWVPGWRSMIPELARVMKPKGHRRAYFTVHDAVMGYFLKGKLIPVNDLTLSKLQVELQAHDFRVEDIIPIHGHDPEAKSMVGNLVIAKYKPSRKNQR